MFRGTARFDDGARGRAGVGRRWTLAPAAMCAGASTCSLPCLIQEPAPEIQGRRGAMQGLQGSGAERGEGGAWGFESKEREGEIERVASGTDAPGGGGRGNRERTEETDQRIARVRLGSGPALDGPWWAEESMAARWVRPHRPVRLSLTTKRKEKKTEIKKEKKEGLGEEVGHADNFPGLTKMCLFRENRKGHD